MRGPKMRTALFLAILFAGFAAVGTLDYHAAAGLAHERTGYAMAGR